MSVDTSQLSKLIGELDAVVGEEVNGVAKRAALGIVEKLVRDPRSGPVGTPRDTGRAAASWRLRRGEAGSDMADPGQYTDPAGSAISAAKKADFSLFGPTKWTIYNNLPYIGRLNDGSSTQAPAKFVDLAVAEVEIELEALLARTRNEI